MYKVEQIRNFYSDTVTSFKILSDGDELTVGDILHCAKWNGEYYLECWLVVNERLINLRYKVQEVLVEDDNQNFKLIGINLITK